MEDFVAFSKDMVYPNEPEFDDDFCKSA